MYRYRRLKAAREAAQETGYRGAMYPWQSGSNGREESQQVHLNPQSGRWMPDNSHLQRHVNAAIAYNICKYYQTSGDMEFLSAYGAEMLLEIARFWSSMATYNDEFDRYEILGVMGPDEYHDSYPEADNPGLANNAYTNIMAVWVLSEALEVLDLLPEDRSRELSETLDLSTEELELWEDISHKMRIIFHDNGIISQFEGYDRLEELDWKKYREKYDNIQRLDRILEAEGDSPNRYKVSKQADVLMLFYLFSSEELQRLFKHLGYPFEYETIPKNIEYYLKRTSHGSTLSWVVHSWVMTRADRVRSWKLFNEALKSDVADIQGGTTPEGIHLGAMAGTVNILQENYTGIDTRGDVLWFSPCLPEELTGLSMHIRYRGHSLKLEIFSDQFTVTALRTAQKPIKIGFNGEVYELKTGTSRKFVL
jgi:alpha,alpha-trehalase